MDSTPAEPVKISAYPAVPVAILIGSGIALAGHIFLLPGVWLAIGSLLLIIGIRKKGWLADLSIAAAIFGIALAAGQIERFGFPPNHLANYTTENQQMAQVELRLDEPPRIVLPPAKELRTLPPKQTASATALRVRTLDGWRDTDGQVILTVAQPNPSLAVGQIVLATGLIERPSPPTNPGEFDYAAYCRNQRVLVTMRVEHADGVVVLNDPGPGALMWLRAKTRHLLAMGFPASRELDASFAQALVLGDSDPQLRDLEDQFVSVGVIYQVSVSGLHFAIVGGFVLLLCRLLRRPPRFSLVASMMAVAIYSALALPSTPGWRAVIMCLVIGMGLLARRRARGFQMLAVAVAAVLLIHPADQSSAGFQIGLAAVIGVILCSGHLEKAFWNWQRGPDGVNEPRPARLWTRLMSLIIAATVAWICTMPLVAYHYQRISSFSAPASLLMMPLSILTLLVGIFKILLTLAWPSAAGLWASMLAMPIDWMRELIGQISKIPFAAIQISSPPVWLTVALYALIAALLMQLRTKWMRWLQRIAWLGAAATLALWPTACKPVTPVSAPSGTLQITLLDVGAGQCGVVQLPGNHVVLMDAGSSTVSDVADRLLEPYLRQNGIEGVDRIFLSHGDFDHISAAGEIFGGFRPSNPLQADHPQILLSPHFERLASGNIPAESLLDTIHDAGQTPTLLHRGDFVDLGEGATVQVLWPPVDCAMNSNNCGLVLKLNFGGKTVLFPADIQEPAELELLKSPAELKSDVLIAPHHGSAELTTGEFLKAVSPKIILASNGKELSRKQKTFNDLCGKTPLYRTSQYGAITLSVDSGGKIGLKTYDSADINLSLAKAN